VKANVQPSSIIRGSVCSELIKTPQLTPPGLRTLTSTFRDYAAQIDTLDAESDGLEWRVCDLVNAAYELSAPEIDLMWRTALPRMPFAR